MSSYLRILHLEDNLDDARLVQLALSATGLACEIKVSVNREQYLNNLSTGKFDIVLSDSSVPGFDGWSAFEAARRQSLTIPFIFVSGTATEKSTANPAADCKCVLKTDLIKLAPLIKKTLDNAAKNTALAETRLSRNPMEYLIAVVQELSLARDLDTIMAIVRRAARDLTGADGATFVLRDGEQCYYADEDAISPLWKGNRFSMKTCISGWVMMNRESAVIEDIYVDDRIPADAYRPTFVKSLAMVPIRTHAPVGAIGNYWAKPHKATPEQVKLLQALADSTSIAMENVQLYKELDQRIAERTAQLDAANRELKAFSYSVSHDLQAPVRRIMGYSQLLLETDTSGLHATGRDYIKRIHRTTLHMAQLINDLLKSAQIAAVDVRKTDVSLSRMSADIIGELQNAAPEREVEFTIAPNITAHGDPHLLRIVLENLLSNAWKYTSKKPQARIIVSCMQEAQGPAVYSVRDNGAGFDMRYADRLFGPFQRLHSEADFPGTGVGLATVQRIIHKHGGRIWAEAAENEGATFFFTLG